MSRTEAVDVRPERVLGPIGAAALAYFVVARLGLLTAVAQPVVSSAWPPTGVALTILLLFGRRLWPGIALGAFLLNWTSGLSAAGAAGIAVGNTLEAVIATVLLGWVGFRPSLERIRDVLALATLGAVLSTAVSATIGVASLWATGGTAPGAIGRLWVVWWSGDAMGDLLVAPLLLTWWPFRAERRWISATLVGLALLAGTGLLFHSGFPYVYPLFPLTIWAAVRLGPRGTATASVVVAAVAIHATLGGIGPFVGGGDVTPDLARVQLFVAVFSLSGLVLAALNAERGTALRAAREAEQHNRLLADEAHASGEAFRLLVEGVRDYAIFWLDALGRVVNWNAGAEHLEGYPADEILGQPHSRLYTPEDVAAGVPNQDLRQAAEAGVCQSEGWRVRKDGSRFWAEAQVSAVRDGGGSLLGFTKLTRDLTERRRAQERLSREAAFVQLLQEVAVAANQAGSVDEALQVAVHDVCRVIGWPVGHAYVVTPEGDALVPSTIWYEEDPAANAPFRRRTEVMSFALGEGLPGVVLARRQPVWIMNVGQDPMFARTEAALASGLRAGFAFPIWSGDEVTGVLEFFAREAAAPDEPLLAVMSHIGTQLGRVIERTRAAQALRSSELRFRAVAESAGDGIVTVDAEGRIVLWNPAAEAIFGRTERDMVGRPVTDLMPERYRDVYAAGLDRTRRCGSGPLVGRTVPLHGLRGDGTEFPMELSLAQWQVGESAFSTAIVRDVTARAQAEEELSQSRERLRDLAARIESMREAERSRIAREIHDELGQALTALKMDLSWLKGRLPKRGAALAAKVEGMVSVVDATSESVQRLATELRPGVLDQLGLPAAVRWQTKEFQGRTGIGCDLELVVEDERKLDDARATAAFRILQEALTNVARHSGATRVRVGFCLTPTALRLTVEDNGRGISEQALKDPRSLGLLGLHERAAILGGSITVCGTPGQGTTVSLTLPRT